MSDNTPAHLKAFVFQPGHPGNPKGRGKGTRNRSTIARELLEQAIPEAIRAKLEGIPAMAGIDLEGKQNVDAVMTSLLVKAMLGDVSAAKELFDSAYGKVDDVPAGDRPTQSMGRIYVEPNGDKPSNSSANKEEPRALVFDVGQAVPEDDEVIEHDND